LASVPDDEHPISCIVVSSAHIRVLRRKMTVEERRRKAGPPVVYINVRASRVSTHGNLNGWKPALLAIIYGISNVEYRVVALAIKLSACNPGFAWRGGSALRRFETEGLLAFHALCLSRFLPLRPDLLRYPGDLLSRRSNGWSLERESLLRMSYGPRQELRCNPLPESDSYAFVCYTD
jgi:hypothetical protein